MLLNRCSSWIVTASTLSCTSADPIVSTGAKYMSTITGTRYLHAFPSQKVNIGSHCPESQHH